MTKLVAGTYRFALLVEIINGDMEVIGPFDSVIEADLWFETNLPSRVDCGWYRHLVVPMEVPGT